MAKIGIHMPGSDYQGAMEQAKGLGMGCMQVMFGSPQQFKPVRVKEPLKGKGDFVVCVHASYLTQYMAKESRKRQLAYNIITSTMKSAHALGADFVVTHVGSGDNWDELVNLDRHIAGLGLSPRLLFENDAGSKNGNRQASVSALVRLRPRVNQTVGLCIDTAHSYANGLIASPELLRKIGPDLIHLNSPDPEVVLGGHLDRHRSVFGTGNLPLEYFKEVWSMCKEEGIPCVVEAPQEIAYASISILGV